MAKIYVKDVQPNDKVESVFKVLKKALPTGKSGKPYLTVTLSDKTGEIDARVWENAEEVSKSFEPGDLVRVTAQTVVHQGHPQLKLDAVSKTDLGELPADDFAPPPPREEGPREPREVQGQGHGVTERRWSELILGIERVADPHVRALLRSFADDPELQPLIKRAPAAKTIHHAYTGGLLEHTVSCMKLANRLCDQYPQADRDLVVAGAFLHDVMKVKELSFERGTEYTDEGRLVGHLVMTAQQIHERARRIEGFPKQLEWHLTHIVLSHHGQLEYGSPKVPQTLEALLVHELDELDSRVNSWLGIMQKDHGENWTEFNKLYDRHIWKGPAPTVGGKRPVESRGGKKRHKVPNAPAEGGKEQGEPQPRAERPPREPREKREDRPPREPREKREDRPPREPREKREPREPRGEVKLTFKPFAAITPAAENPPAENAPEEKPSEQPAEAAAPSEPTTGGSEG